MLRMFYLFHVFRSFLPLHNPIGFGAADFIEFGLAIVLVGLTLSQTILLERARRFAGHTAWCMLALFLLPIALRVAMVGVHPIPAPFSIDDSSYALLADTLTHFRFSNPTHPMHRFFETIFILQEPRYASIYPMGQGIAMAAGQMIFGMPWAGIAISIGAFCAACYWMLRGWTSSGWALLGGVFAALQFGVLTQWMNSFWGGAVSATAGCLVYGALPRLRASGRSRYAVVIGAGIGIQILSRPFETILLVVSVLLYFAPVLWKRAEMGVILRALPVVVLAALPALGLVLLQNKSVTGRWTTMPYMQSRYQYGVPTNFVWQPNAAPHRELTREQQITAEGQASAHDQNVAMGYFGRLKDRVKYYRFFFLAPQYLLVPVFLWKIRDYPYLWVVLTILLFALGTNYYPYFFSHYIAATACLFALMFVVTLGKMNTDGARVVMFVCAAHFVLWYGVHYAGNQGFAHDMWQFETEDAINTGDPQGRRAVHDQLVSNPGKQLVFVRYRAGHTFQEWVYNRADIDSSRIVWARDLGAEDNETLRHYYPDRTAWLLQPDARPPLLTPYTQIAAPKAENVEPAPDKASPKGPKKPLRFEEVK
jgi:hypothetical protein